MLPAPSSRKGSTSSRLRRVIASSGIVPPDRNTVGRVICGRPFGCSSLAYLSSAPTAARAAVWDCSMPRPSKFANRNRCVSSSCAVCASNSQAARSVTMTLSPRPGSSAPSGITISLGLYRSMAAARSSKVTDSRNSSPVETSSAARPDGSPGNTATRKLFRESSRRSSEKTAPGVSVSITARLTIPFAVRGSSTCSQMATRYPRSTKRRT